MPQDADAQALAEWEAQFNEDMANAREDFDYGADMQNMWNSSGGYGDDLGLGLDSPTFDNWGAPMLNPYEFGKLDYHIRGSLLNSLER